jgi:hypothetical protein
MIKEDTYSVKLEKLQPWRAGIFQAIRKELRNEHLLKTPSFAQKYFAKRPLDKLSVEELADAYIREIAEGNEELGEKVVAHWVMKNAEVYQLFATELSKVNPRFDEIDSLPADVSALLLTTSLAQFGAVPTYIFCVMNAVVLTDEQFAKLRELALQEPSRESVMETGEEIVSIEALNERHEKEIRRLTEKYEKRLQGVERKYIQDVDGLKKQIAQLHKKLGAKGACV